MTTIDLHQPADLYLGSTLIAARAQGHRRFSTAEAAIRFAMDQAAPVSLRGAMLRSGDALLSGTDMLAIYRTDKRFARQELPEVSALNLS